MKLYEYNTPHSKKLPPIIPHTFLTRVYHSGMRAKRLQNENAQNRFGGFLVVYLLLTTI